jgi:hypothetical protein
MRRSRRRTLKKSRKYKKLRRTLGRYRKSVRRSRRSRRTSRKSVRRSRKSLRRSRKNTRRKKPLMKKRKRSLRRRNNQKNKEIVGGMSAKHLGAFMTFLAAMSVGAAAAPLAPLALGVAAATFVRDTGLKEVNPVELAEAAQAELEKKAAEDGEGEDSGGEGVVDEVDEFTHSTQSVAETARQVRQDRLSALQQQGEGTPQIPPLEPEPDPEPEHMMSDPWPNFEEVLSCVNIEKDALLLEADEYDHDESDQNEIDGVKQYIELVYDRELMDLGIIAFNDILNYVIDLDTSDDTLLEVPKEILEPLLQNYSDKLMGKWMEHLSHDLRGGGCRMYGGAPSPLDWFNGLDDGEKQIIALIIPVLSGLGLYVIRRAYRNYTNQLTPEQEKVVTDARYKETKAQLDDVMNALDAVVVVVGEVQEATLAQQSTQDARNASNVAMGDKLNHYSKKLIRLDLERDKLLKAEAAEKKLQEKARVKVKEGKEGKGGEKVKKKQKKKKARKTKTTDLTTGKHREVFDELKSKSGERVRVFIHRTHSAPEPDSALPSAVPTRRTNSEPINLDLYLKMRKLRFNNTYLQKEPDIEELDI